MKNMKPMLGVAVDSFDKLTYPLLCSAKIDGVRCLIKDGVALSRSLKPIPNKYIQRWVKENAETLEGLDGELVVGNPFSPTVFNTTTSGVMSRDGEPDFRFMVFDLWKSGDSYGLTAIDRYLKTKEMSHKLPGKALLLFKKVVNSPEEAKDYEEQLLGIGAEGMMVQGIHAGYKFGRSTVKEQKLLKVKRFTDSEYEVVGFEEKMHNANEAKVNAVGNTERSSHKENLIPCNTLGALILRAADGTTFNCGTGFTDEQRDEIWNNRHSLIGKLAKIKSFEIGVVQKPRFPVFLGFRNEGDMS